MIVSRYSLFPHFISLSLYLEVLASSLACCRYTRGEPNKGRLQFHRHTSRSTMKTFFIQERFLEGLLHPWEQDLQTFVREVEVRVFSLSHIHHHRHDLGSIYEP